MASKDKEAAKHVMHNQKDLLNNVFKLHNLIEKAAKDQGVFFNTLSAEAHKGTISTGVLCFDLLMGGGHQPGRFTYFYGPTGSGKSTVIFQTIREAIARGVKVIFLDYEASTDPKYLESLGIDVLHVGGAQGKKGWDREPELYYATPDTAEDGFRSIHTMLKGMGDKIMMEDPSTGMRYFVVEPGYIYSRDWKGITKGLEDKKIYEVEDATPQLLFVVDSLRMLTGAKDDDNTKETIALLARALNDCFTMVKPYLGKKLCNLVGTNHLNINPMAKFGNPEVEPGGKAVEFFPDVKIKCIASRAMSKIVTDQHISGKGEDRYLPGTATVIKNKGGPVFRKMDYRIWLDEQGEPKGGFCPVYDLYQFLLATNQMVQDEKGSTFSITMKGFEHHTKLRYADFKVLALADDDGVKIRQTCFEQLKDGRAQELYYENAKGLKDDANAKKKAKALAGLDAVQGGMDSNQSGGDDEPAMPRGEQEISL